MTTSKALVTRGAEGKKARLSHESIELDAPPAKHVLVRVRVAAQNPTDGESVNLRIRLCRFADSHVVQSLDSNAFGELAVLGCDFTGTVEALGSDVSLLKKGDLIAGLLWGGEIKGLGAYSEHVFADEQISFKVPKGTTEKSAATLPLACTTAWLALYSQGCLKIDRHATENTPILIWGGSSSVGLYAIQLAHLFGIPVVAICGPQNFELCKDMGADYVFNYKDPSVVEQVKIAVPNIAHVFDTIGAGSSSTQASQTIGVAGGALCTVRPGKANTENVEGRVNVTDVLVWTAFLKDHQYKEFKWPASEEDHELAAELFRRIPGWLEAGRLKPNTVHTIPGGLMAVEKGFQMHREGQISGFKVVYEI